MARNSLRDQMAKLGGSNATAPITIPGGFHSWPMSGGLRAALRATWSPNMTNWTRPAEQSFDNRAWTEECQGIATDGIHWYVSSNDQDYRGIYKLSASFGQLSRARAPVQLGNHIGDIDYYDGMIYAPIEPGGYVAMFDTTPQFINDARLTHNGGPPPQNHFPWCAINPWNGYLYSSDFNDVETVYAFDPDSGFELVDKLRLGGAPVDRVQGGCFSDTGRLYLASDVEGSEAIRAYSVLNGQYLGRKSVTVDNSPTVDEEVEGITIGQTADSKGRNQLHMILLDNDWPSSDDVILKHFAAPTSSLL